MESISFPVAFCPSCKVDVLLYADIDPNDAMIHRCVRCDEAITDDTQNVGSEALGELGYALMEKRGCGGSCGVKKAQSPAAS